jgi:nucleotide-binding universal stress UspA family protein
MISRILVAVDLTETAETVPLEALEAARVVRPRDGTASTERLLREALALARGVGASLEIAYVRRTRARAEVEPPWNAVSDEVDEWIDRELAKLGQVACAAGVSCTTTSLEGPVRRVLVSHAKKMNPDLIVLGSHRSWRGLPRSAEHMLVRARHRVLVIPANTAGH